MPNGALQRPFGRRLSAVRPAPSRGASASPDHPEKRLRRARRHFASPSPGSARTKTAQNATFGSLGDEF
eukprot:11192820-Alexandrium_andersonii.AAC.1